MIKQLKNLEFINELMITMILNATNKLNILINETIPSVKFSATNKEITDIAINNKQDI